MQHKLLAPALICAGIGALNAADFTHQDMQPGVDWDSQGVTFSAPSNERFIAMNVRVYTQDGDLVFQARSIGESIDITSAELADGEYRYESVSIMTNNDAEEPEIVKRNFGSFKVKNGELQAEKKPLGQDLTQVLGNTIGIVLHKLIPSAQADTFSSVTIESSAPALIFNDTDSIGLEWGIAAADNFYGIYDYANLGYAITIDRNSNNSSSLSVDSSGDVSLANGALTIDRSSSHLGIGTTTPNYELDIHDSIPEIRFYDATDDTVAHIQYNAGELVLEGNSQQDIFIINGTAPADSLVIDNTGWVGIGTSSPSVPLEIERSDGTAKFRVRELSPVAAPRTLFELVNLGNTKFSLTNTEAEVEWAFANPGTGFRVSRQGSGVVEFDLLNNGNLTIAGSLTENSDRHAKTNIVDIDAQEILEKVATLPIQQWQYKDAQGENHIGPMAQDFYAAFGLGATDKGIATLDSAGVALAAIQALVDHNQTLQTRVEQLEQQNQRLLQLERLVLALYENDETKSQLSVYAK